MFNLRKLVVYFLLLIVLFVFFKKDGFTFFKEKINKQETILLKASEKKLDRRDVMEKNSGASLDTTSLEENYLPRYNEDTQTKDIDIMSKELVTLESLAKENKVQSRAEFNVLDITPQRLLDMEFVARQEEKEGSISVEIESSTVTPQELLNIEYSTKQEEKEGSISVEIESSTVTPQELLNMEYSARQEEKEGSISVEIENSSVTPQELLDMEYSVAQEKGEDNVI